MQPHRGRRDMALGPVDIQSFWRAKPTLQCERQTYGREGVQDLRILRRDAQKTGEASLYKLESTLSG